MGTAPHPFHRHRSPLADCRPPDRRPSHWGVVLLRRAGALFLTWGLCEYVCTQCKSKTSNECVRARWWVGAPHRINTPEVGPHHPVGRDKQCAYENPHHGLKPVGGPRCVLALYMLAVNHNILAL